MMKCGAKKFQGKKKKTQKYDSIFVKLIQYNTYCFNFMESKEKDEKERRWSKALSGGPSSWMKQMFQGRKKVDEKEKIDQIIVENQMMELKHDQDQGFSGCKMFWMTNILLEILFKTSYQTESCYADCWGLLHLILPSLVFIEGAKLT